MEEEERRGLARGRRREKDRKAEGRRMREEERKREECRRGKGRRREGRRRKRRSFIKEKELLCLILKILLIKVIQMKGKPFLKTLVKITKFSNKIHIMIMFISDYIYFSNFLLFLIFHIKFFYLIFF